MKILACFSATEVRSSGPPCSRANRHHRKPLILAAMLSASVVFVACERGDRTESDPAPAAAQPAEPADPSVDDEAEEPGAAAPDPSELAVEGCPKDVQLEAVFCPEDVKFGADVDCAEASVVAHEIVGRGGVDEMLEIDDEEAESLGRPELAEPYWVFPRDGGPACRMEPEAAVLVPVTYLDFLDLVVLTTRLTGDCEHLDDDDSARALARNPLFAVQSETMSEDCRVNRRSIGTVERGEGTDVPDGLRELHERLDSDGGLELGCDEELEDCQLHWRWRELELNGDRRLVSAETVEIHPWPDEPHPGCLYNIEGSWASGVVLEEGERLRRLAPNPWPEAVFLGVEGQRESILGLTNNQTKLLTWSVDDDGPSEETSTYQWWEYHEEEMTEEAGLISLFVCGP